jgi:hypothetical protein
LTLNTTLPVSSQSVSQVSYCPCEAIGINAGFQLQEITQQNGTMNRDQACNLLEIRKDNDSHTIADVVNDRSGTKKPGFRTVIFPGYLAANDCICDGYSLGLGEKHRPTPPNFPVRL